MSPSKIALPSALERLDFWRERRRHTGHLLLALDFDGTLAPIVPHPDDAQLLHGARVVLEQLLKRSDTEIAIVSGRSLADLKRRCGLPGLDYAGNHGLQIDGPGVHETQQAAVALLPQMRACAGRLAGALAGLTGVYFEDKELSLSVHFRTVESPAEQQRIVERVERTVAEAPAGLRLTYGKRVVEIRPDIDWNKGHATLYLLKALRAARKSEVFPIFVGDDLTDEDAFRALRGIGDGVLVAEQLPEHTHATLRVGSLAEVILLLKGLTE